MMSEVKKNKRAQEEMVGLVMIMLVVAVIFLVFLGIYLRQKSTAETEEDPGTMQFIDAAIEYTTNCTVGGVLQSVEELIVKCIANMGLRCADGREACGANGALKKDIEGMIKTSWNTTGEGTIKGYEFGAEFVSTGGNSPILGFSEGTCTGVKRRGAEKPLSVSGGKIIISFYTCL